MVNELLPKKRKENKILTLIKKKSSTLALFRDLMWKFGTWDSKELNEWIQQFKPTEIFAVLGGCIFTHRIAITLSDRYNIPLSTYFTDDYIIGNISTNILQRIHHRQLEKVYIKTLAVSKKSFVIGEKMQEAYQSFFHREFGILVNGIDLKLYSKFKPKKIEEQRPIIVSYIGGLHLNRWQSIVNLARITSKLDKYCLEYRVFCVSSPDNYILSAFAKAGVLYCGSLDSEGVLKQMEKSHFLLHIESFDDKNRIYTRFSISTKIPEYMASRRGIIAYGPSDVASIEIFKKNKLGCVLTELDTEEMIKEKVIMFIQKYSQYNYEEQYQYAAKHFDQKKMQLNKVL